MKGINKVILIGNLGRDPEISYTGSGQAVCRFSLATTEQYTANGERKERTEWHRVTAWGKLAEICGEYLFKGSSVFIEGSLKTERWKSKDGQEKEWVVIIANSMQMLGGSSDSEKPTPPKPKPKAKEQDFDEEQDIPF